MTETSIQLLVESGGVVGGVVSRGGGFILAARLVVVISKSSLDKHQYLDYILFPKVPLPEVDMPVRWDSTLDHLF